MRSRLLSSTYSKTFVKYLILILGSTILTNYSHAQTPHIADCQHYSKVFNEILNYRIVLPPLYDQHIEKKYPVIYYYHGWSQRYFGSTGWSYDDPDRMNMQNIIDFVSSKDIKSDDEGRITFNLDGSDHWIGINEKGSRHLMVKLVSFETSEGIYALHGNETNMKIKLFNAGLNPINEIQVKIRPFIPDNTYKISTIRKGI